MVSFGSGKGTNTDFRWPTDGVFYQYSTRGFRDILDGTSSTVLMSESVRSQGSDTTFTGGDRPPFPYRMTLNGSSGVSSGLNATQGMKSSGGPWSAFVDGQGMIVDPDLNVIWTSFSSWRGGDSPALRGRGMSWAFTGALATMTNGYNPPNSRVPDLVTHFTGYFGPRSYHTAGSERRPGRRIGAVPAGHDRPEAPSRSA